MELVFENSHDKNFFLFDFEFILIVWSGPQENVLVDWTITKAAADKLKDQWEAPAVRMPVGGDE